MASCVPLDSFYGKQLSREEENKSPVTNYKKQQTYSLPNNTDADNFFIEERVERSRERNREHAKRTRLRKKAVIEAMKGKLLSLQKEASHLQQLYEESKTANILLCLGTKKSLHDIEGDMLSREDSISDFTKFSSDSDQQDGKGKNIIEELRNKVRMEAAKNNQNSFYQSGEKNANSASRKRPHPESQTRQSFGSGSTSPPSSSCSDENGSSNGSSSNRHNQTTSTSNQGQDSCDEDDEDDDEKDKSWESIDQSRSGSKESSTDDGEVLRKERNRMHAKLTRDRKKLFTSKMQQMISDLEKKNAIIRNKVKWMNGGEM